MPMHFLTDAEVALIQRVLDESRGRSINPPVRNQEEQDYQAPETYIAKATSDIAARDDGSSPPLAGTGDCDIYRITINGSGDPEIVQMMGLERKVYNISDSDITSGSYFAITRTKSGKWIPVIGSGSSTPIDSCGCDRCYTQGEMSIDVGGGWFAAPGYSIVTNILTWVSGTTWEQATPFQIDCSGGSGTGTSEIDVFYRLTVNSLEIGGVVIELILDSDGVTVLATWKNLLSFWKPHCGSNFFLESQSTTCALFAADCLLCLKVDADSL